MGCGASKAAPAAPAEPVVPRSTEQPADLSADYKKNYDPAHDEEGNPLSSLLSCPVIATMYNAGQFPTLAALKAAAVAEEFTGWDSSPNHLALYESCVTTPDMIASMQSVNCSEPVARLIVDLVSKDPKLFQLHDIHHKHGEATRIRYDYQARTGGFSQSRFDTWWTSLDRTTIDDHMCHDEMTVMMDALESKESLQGAAPDWVKKFAVFTIIFTAFGGTADGNKDGVPKSVFESLYKGCWPDETAQLPRQLNRTKLFYECFRSLLKGAA